MLYATRYAIHLLTISSQQCSLFFTTLHGIICFYMLLLDLHIIRYTELRVCVCVCVAIQIGCQYLFTIFRTIQHCYCSLFICTFDFTNTLLSYKLLNFLYDLRYLVVTKLINLLYYRYHFLFDHECTFIYCSITMSSMDMFLCCDNHIDSLSTRSTLN